ncbi:hypothetical protein D3C84_711540 [compost metagenome]
MTRRMIRTRAFHDFNEGYFINRLPKCCRDHPNIRTIIIDVYDEISDMMAEVMSLPTWYDVSMRVSGTAIRMEVGEDHRITQWTEEHAHEYSTNYNGKGW